MENDESPSSSPPLESEPDTSTVIGTLLPDPNVEEALQSTLNEIERDLDQLYSLRENYSIPPNERLQHIQRHSAQLIVKQELIANSELTPSLLEASIPSSTSTRKLRAKLLFLQGKTLNVFEDSYNKDAEILLTKAVKLDPWLIEAWNCLGECFWNKGDLETSFNCFRGANQRVMLF